MVISVILIMELIDYRIPSVTRPSAFITTRKNESIEKRSIQLGHVNTVNCFSGITPLSSDKKIQIPWLQ